MSIWKHFLACLVTIVVLASCGKSPEPTAPKRDLNGAPIGAVVRPLAGSFSGNKLTFSLDLYIVDEDGNFVANLPKENITIGNVSSIEYSLQNLQGGRLTSKGAYSAMMLMDQSGSILDTDPDDLRIDAGRIFIKALGKNDQAALSAFSGFYTDYYALLSEFTQDTTQLLPPLDALATTERGGTPLYIASNAMVDYTSTNAPSSNKAVIIFTDGDNTYSGVTLTQLIDNAKAKGVQLYTVGLGNGINTRVLAEVAAKGDGSFIYASEAKQLITAFGTLGDLLNGSGQIYKSTWEAVNTYRDWTKGDIINATVTVSLPGAAKPIELPFQIVIN